MSNQHDLNLDDAANRFDIPAGDVDAVVSRGRTRSQRRRAVMATVTTIAVVTGAASFIGTRGTDGDGDDTNVAAEVSGDAKLGDDQFTWTRSESAKGLTWAPAVGGSGQLYALSTGPGERMSESVRQNGHVYRSSDGVDWQSVSRLGSDMFLSDLAPSSERLYAVGTGPATAVAGRTAKSSELIAGWSDDGGKTWSKAALPFDMKAVAAKTLNSSVTDTEVAASPKGTLAAAVVRAALDVPALLPAGATAPNGWATTATGVDVLGPKKSRSVCPAGTTAEKGGDPGQTRATEVGPTYCHDENAPDRSSTTVVSPQDARGVTASYTWDQLGVTGDLLRAARGELVAFFAEPGSTDFVRVDTGSEQAGAPLLAIAAEDGFDIVKSSAPKPMGPAVMSVLHSADGRTWAPTSTDSKMAFASYAGLLGATPVVLGGSEQGAPVMMRRTPTGWVSTDLSPLVARPADTEVFIGSAGVGPAGAAVSVSITNEQRDESVNRLLTTRDGVTWHDQSVDELAGRKVGGVGMVVVTGERVVVSTYLPKTDGKAETAPRLTLIGTPR